MTPRKCKIFFALLVGASTCSAAFAQGSLSGTWDITLQTPQGANTVELSLTQEGAKLAGDLTSPLGSVPISGTVTDNDVILSAEVALQGMSLQFGLKGTLVGESLSGTVAFGDFGEFPFSGKRAAPKASSAAPTAPADRASPTGADATGKWDITLRMGALGDFPLTADLRQEGQNVTGTFRSQAGGVEVKGTMTGAKLRIEFSLDTPQGPLPLAITGDLTEAGFTGKASLAGMGEADWVGVRSK